MTRVVASLAIAAASAFLAACGSTPAEQAKAAAVPRNPLEIVPDSELQRRIAIGEPRVQAVAGVLRVAGRVEADETRLARVSAPVTGRIVDLNVVAGQPVRRGQVLAKIYSTELSTAQSGYLKSRSQHQAAERAVSRARLLLDAGVIGSAELQRREAELQQAAADLSAAREQLRVLGFSDDQIQKIQSERSISSTSEILSSIDGILMERHATIGQLVQAVETVFVIADLSHVWLIADIPEQSAGSIRVGKSIEAEIPAVPGEKISGRISFVSAIVNPETRTVRVRMDLPNPQQRFKPAMLANMMLVDGAEQRLVVPSTAVVRENNADHVFVESAPGKFVLQRVVLGDDAGEMRVVQSGLQNGMKIVTNGAFHLNNERKRLALGDESGD